MEGVLARFAQFDNDVRFDRTRAGMKAAFELGPEGLVDQMFASWNRIASWLRQIDGLNRSRYKSTGTSPP
jgi:hypothetical protein